MHNLFMFVFVYFMMKLILSNLGQDQNRKSHSAVLAGYTLRSKEYTRSFYEELELKKETLIM